MYRIDRGDRPMGTSQKGTTLVLALVLVLLATLMGLFALNVGIFGQRTSAIDVRSRLTRQTAEAALSQGIEYFRNNNTVISDPTTSSLWEKCLANDTSYPCGTVEQCAPPGLTDSTGGSSTSSTSCSGDLQRRGNMYRYIGKANYDVNGSGGTTDTVDNRSLPLNGQMTLMTTVGNGFGVNYGVGALLCVVKTPATSTDPTECTTSSNNASSTRILTLTSLASIPGENSATTLSSSFGMHSSVYSPTNKPPVVASGSVDITGGIQVVTNPDAGGNGVPISIWTRKAVSKTGTPNTCYFDDYIRDQKNNASPAFEPNSPNAKTATSTVVTCDTCQCSNSISYQTSGNNPNMGIDILDVDSVPEIGTTACTTTLNSAGSCKANRSVGLPDATTGLYEFPCDMFQYVFGVAAWSDSDGDGFCETRMTSTIPVANNTNQTMGADEAYLYQNATQIIAGTMHPQAWIDSSKLATDCSPLTNSTGATAQGGLIWVQYGANCSFDTTLQIGTPDLPVVLVVDGNMTGSQVYHSRMFGLLFVRAPDTPLDPSTGGSTSTHGGSLFMNSGSVVYGSVVIQGQMIKGNGTASIVYNKTVLSHLLSEPGLNPFAAVPASWTDRFAY